MSAHAHAPSRASAKPEKRQCNETMITDTNDNDVLLGRGNHVNKRLGNVRFRKLIQKYKEEYSISRKHLEKNILARKVRNEVLRRGGRFLRKAPNQSFEDGNIIWEIVDATAVVSKIKQAFRDNNVPNPIERRMHVPLYFRDRPGYKTGLLAMAGSPPGVSTNKAFSSHSPFPATALDSNDSSYPLSTQNITMSANTEAQNRAKRDSCLLMQSSNRVRNAAAARPQLSCYHTPESNTSARRGTEAPYQLTSFAQYHRLVNHGVDKIQVNQSVPLEMASTDIKQRRFLLDQLSEQSLSTIGQHELSIPFASQFKVAFQQTNTETHPPEPNASAHTGHFDSNPSSFVGRIQTEPIQGTNDANTMNFPCLPLMTTTNSRLYAPTGMSASGSWSSSMERIQHQRRSSRELNQSMDMDHSLLSLFSHQQTMLAGNLQPGKIQQQHQPTTLPQSHQNLTSSYPTGAAQHGDPHGLHDALLGIQLAHKAFASRYPQYEGMAPTLPHTPNENNESLEPNPVMLDRVGREIPAHSTSVLQQDSAPHSGVLQKRNCRSEQPPPLLDYRRSIQTIPHHQNLRSMSPRPLREDMQSVPDALSFSSSSPPQERESDAFTRRHSLDLFNLPSGPPPSVTRKD